MPPDRAQPAPPSSPPNGGRNVRRAGDSPRWTLDDIPWQKIEQDRLAGREDLFTLVAGASFVEATTALYTRNLIDHFGGDDEVTLWLQEYWLPEELQHGRALRHYVEAAWPGFAWEEVYRPFLEDYAPCCRLDALEPVRGLEMASRCVVETGTASYYTTLSRASPEPVLSFLTRRIAEDEVRHYKHFYRYFRRYREGEGVRRFAVLRALWRRLRMTEGEDSYLVLKHVYLARHPGRPFDRRVYHAVRRQFRASLVAQFPYAMGVKMLLKPLGLPPRAGNLVEPLVEALARRLVP
jgi:hypothetical protein